MGSPSLISWFYVVALSFLVAAGKFDADYISPTNGQSEPSQRNEQIKAPREFLPLPSFQRNIRRIGTALHASPKHPQFNRRLGPFISGGLTGPKRAPPRRPPPSGSRVHHHPYMEQPHHPRERPNRRQQRPGNGKPPPYQRQPRPPPPPTPASPKAQQSWPTQNPYDLPPPPPPTIQDPFSELFSDIATVQRTTTQLPRNTIKRKLLLPIISGGYAQTNFQGGNRQNQNDRSAVNGDEVALQVVASNDLTSFSKTNQYTDSSISNEDADVDTRDKTASNGKNIKNIVTASVDLVEQANVSQIPKLSWSSTTTTAPLPTTDSTTTPDNTPRLSESSPYFPQIPQVAQTEAVDDTLTKIEGSDDGKDVALIIKDKLTDIFRVPEQDGMYDERQDLFAAQNKIDNNYFSVDLSTSFGGKPLSPSQNRIQIKQKLPQHTPIKQEYVATIEEVPLFNGVDFSSSNTRQQNPVVDDLAVNSNIEKETTSTTTTTPSPFILQPGSPMLATNLEEATSITEDQLANVKDKDQYVRFLSMPPKQININIPSDGSKARIVEGTHSQTHQTGFNTNNLDASGHFTPASNSVPYSPFYQAGYHSALPGEGQEAGQFPGSIDPREVNPDIYHEDRPTLPQHLSSSSNGNRVPVKSIYPLGKAPPKNEDKLPALLGKGPAKRPKATFEGAGITVPSSSEVRKPKPKATSFLDFLTPSFLSGWGASSRADPEGPTHTKNAPPKQSNNALKSIKKLPVPTRPPNTFPDPQALGGRLNPIMIKVPGNGFPSQGPPPEFFPRPPSLEDWERHAEEQQNVLAARKGSQISRRLEQENPLRSINQIEQEVPINGKMRDNLYAPGIPLPDERNMDTLEPYGISNEIESVDIEAQVKQATRQARPQLKLPVPPPPMANVPMQNKRIPPIHPPRQPILQKAPLPMTSQPVIGLPRVPPGRKQAPFLMGHKQKPLRPPVVSPQNAPPQFVRKQQRPITHHIRGNSNSAPFKRNPNFPNKYTQENPDYIKPTSRSRQENEDYLAKLKDPEFVQNLTRSYVFHHTDPTTNKNADQNRNIVGQGPVSYVPQATIDPFFFRPQTPSKAKSNTNRNSQIITKTNNKISLQRQSGFHRHELPSLDLIAPPSQPVSSKRISINTRPEAVYRAQNDKDTNPLSAYDRRNTIYKRITERTPIVSTTTTELPSSTERITMKNMESSSLIPTTNNPIAEHISSLLKQYLSMDSSNNHKKGTPTLSYDDKQNTVVLEYLSPDGENSNKSNEDESNNLVSSMKVSEANGSPSIKQSSNTNIARVDEGSDTLIATEATEASESNNVNIEDANQIQDILRNDEGFASYLAHLQEQKEHNFIGTGKTIQDNVPSPISNVFEQDTFMNKNEDKSDIEHASPLDLNKQDPKKTFMLDTVFEPSATPTDSDWFILDESGKRQRTMSKIEIEEVKHIIEEANHSEVENSNEKKEYTKSTINEISKDSLNSVELTQSPSEEIAPNADNAEVEMFGGFQPVVGPTIDG